MKHIIRINGKLLEECTPEERRKMDQAIVDVAKNVLGLVIHIDESKYATTQPGSERV